METIFVWWVWAVIAIITLIAEVLLPSFTVGCFSVGALVAAVLSACGVGVNTQLIPFAVKYLLKKGKDAVATNQDALVGRVGRLTKAIEDPTLKGEVRIDGDIFPARSIDNSPIEAGEDVRVVRIDSIVMVVVPVK